MTSLCHAVHPEAIPAHSCHLCALLYLKLNADTHTKHHRHLIAIDTAKCSRRAWHAVPIYQPPAMQSGGERKTQSMCGLGKG